MRLKKVPLVVFCMFIVSCASGPPITTQIGQFRVESDLLLAHFDCKTDVDDVHSIAGVATMLADPRFRDVTYHAVAGTYGTQDGEYVPANELFEAAFAGHWSDAHSEYDGALKEVTRLVSDTLEKGGDIWIAEAGQSDFSADLIRTVKKTLPDIETTKRIHVVQHSDWNENNTASDNLSFVKENTHYHKIPDGNIVGNGSPGFKSDEMPKWRDAIHDGRLLRIWEMALEIADRYNGKDGRYNNPAVAGGGMDFSDVSEACWIFGFNHLKNAGQFFEEFTGRPVYD
jgi:hypothetical protein